jgi:hypothetical protein
MFTTSHLKYSALLLSLLGTLGIFATATAQQSGPPTLTASIESTQPALVLPASNYLISSSSSIYKELTGRDNAEGVIRVSPELTIKKELPSQRPFRTAAFGIKANTLGVGAELATPLARSFNLRSGINLIAFNYPFRFDGVSYSANLHLNSSQSTLDWFPGGHSFHISPGLLYLHNASSASLTVPPGQNFVFGGETFLNSVGDPVNGKMSLVFPHTLSPLLLIGVGNMLPRSNRRLSIPFEVGAAYTGPATVIANLTGSACTIDGCFSFAKDADAQSRLNREIQKANNLLKDVPFYPVISFGVAYHF